MSTVALVFLVGLVLPFTPVAGALGLLPLPLPLFEVKLGRVPSGTSNLEVVLRSPRDGEVTDLVSIAVVAAP